MTRRQPRAIPLRFDDGFRGAITSAPLIPVVVAALALRFATADLDPTWFVASLCAALTAFSLAYLIWTHLVFTRVSRSEARRIGGMQHRRGPSALTRWLGMGDSTSWTISGAVASLLAAVSASVLGHGVGGVWLASGSSSRSTRSRSSPTSCRCR